MKRSLPVLAGGLILAVSGLVHGLWTDRWGASAAVEVATSRLNAVPLQIGDWQGEPLDLDARQLSVAEATGHLGRRYVERGSGREVNVVLLCGRSGPLSVHQPDVCYTGAGYQLSGGTEKWSAPPDASGNRYDLWVARFTRPGHDAVPLRVFWAWSAEGDWRASEQPRLTFGGRSALYKLYVIHRMARPDETIDEGAGRAFMQVLLPELRKCLAPAQDQNAERTGGR
jgi:hypothetical protein